MLRRILRRIVRNMRLLGAHGSTMHELVATTIGVMAPQYPELARDADRIHCGGRWRRKRPFFQRCKQELPVSRLPPARAQAEAPNGAVLSGDQAFALHDTYGFPIDLTLEMAAEQGPES